MNLRSILPIWRLDALSHRWNYLTLGLRRNAYEQLYERLARRDQSDTAIGGGDFEHIGRMELDLLLMEGLKPTDTLVDLGCGSGRLAMHVIPMLQGSRYIGIDISATFLKRAAARVQKTVSEPPCDITWLKQTTPHFDLADRSVAMMCAFSVFTHMEAEDNYQYLKAALRVMRRGGRFIFSCLPLQLPYAKGVFLGQARISLAQRWSSVRDVTTSEDFMTEIAQLAGWNVVRWYRGDEANIGRLPGALSAFGQSACVLEPK